MSKVLPHIGVYTRLKPSSVHGVGVFAIRDIPKGINVFGSDNSEMVWLSKGDIKNVDPEVKKLYDDFCVIKGDEYGCPENFNGLTISWYINESKGNPNVQCTKDYDFISLRDIKKGEELLINYADYSDYPDSKD